MPRELGKAQRVILTAARRSWANTAVPDARIDCQQYDLRPFADARELDTISRRNLTNFPFLIPNGDVQSSLAGRQ